MKRLKVPQSEVEVSFSKSSGPGGQNVNKVSTRATVKWDFESSGLCNDGIKARIRSKYKSYIFQDGFITISSQKYRTQQRNLADCMSRLNKLLDTVRKPPKARKKTKPTKASVEKRLTDKKHKSEKKRLRKTP